MYLRLKNLRLRPLLIHMIVTLAYPAAKAAISAQNRLLIFVDSATIVALILLIFGLLFSMVLHGDFDVSAFVLQRGLRRDKSKSFSAYMDDQRQKREDAFNYPLFLGLVYLAAAALIAWIFL